MKQRIRIVGIDPGLQQTGWGIIEIKGSYLHFLAAGTVKSNEKAPLAYRLAQLYQGLLEVLQDGTPHEAAVEHIFVNKNATATLKLGQARGISLLVTAQMDIPVSEYAPNTIKKAVIGAGHGKKQQIHMMVKTLLPCASFDTNDAADALAVAICHAHGRKKINEM